MNRPEKNRSKFVAGAIRSELDRRRRQELRKSLDNPRPESSEFPDEGLSVFSASGGQSRNA